MKKLLICALLVLSTIAVPTERYRSGGGPLAHKSEQPVFAEKSEEGQLVGGVPLVGGLLGGISNPIIRRSKSEEGGFLDGLLGTQPPRRSKSEEAPILAEGPRPRAPMPPMPEQPVFAEKSEGGQLDAGVPLVGGLLGGYSNPIIRRSKSEEGQLVGGVPLVGGLLGGYSNPTITRSKSEEAPVLAEAPRPRAPMPPMPEQPVFAEKSEGGQLDAGVPLVGGLLGGYSNPIIRRSKSEEGGFLDGLLGAQPPRRSKSEEALVLAEAPRPRAPMPPMPEQPVFAEKSEEGQLVGGLPLVGGLLGGISNPTIRTSKSEHASILAEKSEEGQLVGGLPLVGGLLGGYSNPTITRSKSEEAPVLAEAPRPRAPMPPMPEQPVFAEKSEGGQLDAGVPLVGGLLGGYSNPIIRRSKSEEGGFLDGLLGAQPPRRSKSEQTPVLLEAHRNLRRFH